MLRIHFYKSFKYGEFTSKQRFNGRGGWCPWRAIQTRLSSRWRCPGPRLARHWPESQGSLSKISCFENLHIKWFWDWADVCTWIASAQLDSTRKCLACDQIQLVWGCRRFCWRYYETVKLRINRAIRSLEGQTEKSALHRDGVGSGIWPWKLPWVHPRVPRAACSSAFPLAFARNSGHPSKWLCRQGHQGVQHFDRAGFEAQDLGSGLGSASQRLFLSQRETRHAQSRMSPVWKVVLGGGHARNPGSRDRKTCESRLRTRGLQRRSSRRIQCGHCSFQSTLRHRSILQCVTRRFLLPTHC